MLEEVAQLVGADGATLTRIDLRTGHEVVVMWPTERADSDRLQGYASASAGHPLRPPLADQARSATDPHPVRISDVLSGREWRRSALYATSHHGVQDQMSVLLGAHRWHVQAVTLSRYQGVFTDRQLELLRAGRVQLTAAFHRTTRLIRPLLQLTPELRWTAGAMAIPVADVRRRQADAPVDVASVRVESAGRQPVSAANAPTERQREILSLVAHGMTDAQIGRRLGLTTATVSKHLSRAYSRTGVPNRTAAAQLFAS